MNHAAFPASAANSLIDGYCDDFSSFAAVLAQTLTQVSNRDIPFDRSRQALSRLEHGMREMATAINGMLAGHGFELPLAASEAKEPAPRAVPARSLSDAADPAAPRIKGDNRSMPLLSVCQFLGRLRKSGILHVSILDEHVTFEFVDGHVQYTTSTGCPQSERTGELLVALGFCRYEDLLPIMTEAAERNLPLSDLLLKAGLVNALQLRQALESQMHMRFARACQTLLATYEFEEGTCQPTDGRVRVSPLDLAWEQRQKRG